MNKVEFLNIYYSNFYENNLLVIIIVSFYLNLFRKSFLSVIDPLFLGVLAQAFSAAVVLVLYLSGYLDLYYLYSFIFTELAFLAGCFALFRSPALTKIDTSLLSADIEEIKIFFSVFFIFFLGCSALYISMVGLLLFKAESRLVIMQDIGVISWFTDILWASAPLVFFIKRFILKLRNHIDYILLILSILFLFTKGGKSDFLPIIFSVFLVSYIFSITTLGRTIKILMIVTPILLLLATSITLIIWNVNTNIFSFIFNRFLLFGDAFFEGYNQNFMNSLPDCGFFQYFFHSVYTYICNALGILPEPKVILGYEMSKFYYNISEGMGPNARHNILGLYLFGPYGSIVFSFFTGLLLAILRKGLWLDKGWIFIFLYSVTSLFSYLLMIDPSLAIGYFVKILIVMGSILFVSLLVLATLRKRA